MESRCPPLRPQQKDLQLLSSIFSSRAHETSASSSSPRHFGPGRTGQLYLKLYGVSGKPLNVGADVFMSGKVSGWHLSIYDRFITLQAETRVGLTADRNLHEFKVYVPCFFLYHISKIDLLIYFQKYICNMFYWDFPVPKLSGVN